MSAAFERYIGIDYSGAETCESYPALWSHSFPRDGRDSHQQGAYATTEWLRRSDPDGALERFFSPSLTDRERKVAEIEGWIQGIA